MYGSACPASGTDASVTICTTSSLIAAWSSLRNKQYLAATVNAFSAAATSNKRVVRNSVNMRNTHGIMPGLVSASAPG